MLTFSCNVEEDAPQQEAVANKTIVLNSKQKVASANLDVKYHLNAEVYNKFLSKLVFENGHIRGAYYGDIHKVLDEKQRENFWNEFGIVYKNGEFVENTRGFILLVHHYRDSELQLTCQFIWDHFCLLWVPDDDQQK